MNEKVEITKDRVIEDLKQLGMSKGDHVGVALSFKSIGYVKGGPDAFIDALLETVGPKGTIMMPAFTKSFPISKTKSGKIEYIFDYKLTPSYTGLVPNAFLKRTNTIRSHHPINSVAALGKFAKYLTKDHDENSRPFIPYSRLTKLNGKIMCVGIGDRIVAIRHEAQDQAGLLNIVPLKRGTKFRDSDGIVKIYKGTVIAGCAARLHELVPNFRKMGFVIDGKIGMAKSVVVSAKKFLEYTTGMLKDDPSLNLCTRISCLWCRELERRLELYDNIENPKYFQKYIVVRKIIATINFFRLRDSKLIVPLRLIMRIRDALQRFL